MSLGMIYLRNGRHPGGAFLRQDAAGISPDDRGFVFGDGVYEVIRTYSGRPFMLPEHLDRLERSLAAVRIELPDRHMLEQTVLQALDANDSAHADAMVYVQITRGEAQRAHPFPSPAVPPTIYMAVSGAPDCARVQAEGARLVTLSDFRWSRCDIKTIALQANVLALQHARERGADECLFVRDGMLTEGSHTNFFGILNGVVRTHPATNHILAGITRACVLDICRQEDIACAETPLAETELTGLEEAFISATSYEVTPIVAINSLAVGDGQPGPVTRRLQERFRAITRAEYARP